MTASKKFDLELNSINPMNIQYIALVADEDRNPSVLIQAEGEQKYFPVVEAFQIHKINEFIRGMNIVNEISFHSFTQYGHALDHVCRLLQINKIMTKHNFKATAQDVHEVMLDGFKGVNLVKKATAENNYEKYVLMAVERFNKAN